MGYVHVKNLRPGNLGANVIILRLFWQKYGQGTKNNLCIVDSIKLPGRTKTLWIFECIMSKWSNSNMNPTKTHLFSGGQCSSIFSRVASCNLESSFLWNIFLKSTTMVPGQMYVDVIHPSDLPKEVPLDRHTTLRVFCRWVRSLPRPVDHYPGLDRCLYISVDFFRYI
jgi:hypothetical protein